MSSSKRGDQNTEPPAKRSRAEKSEKPSSRVTAASGKGDVEEAANPRTDRVVSLNVGGSVVTTLETTLRSAPSQFTEWLDNDFHGFPRDAEGRPFLDCDVKNFKYVLNYLRGYGLPADSDDLVMLAEDAVRFNMEALQRDIGVKAPPLWKFNPGPGVSPDGSQFSTADTLSLCGTNALSPSLTHTIIFRVDKCDAVAVGVVAFNSSREDQQIFDQRQSVCYRSSGEMVRSFGDEPLFSPGAAFTNTSLVTVRLRFLPEGTTNASLPPLVRAPALPPAEEATATTAATVADGPEQPALAGFTTANLVNVSPQQSTAQQLPQTQHRPPPPPPPPPPARPPRALRQQRNVTQAASFPTSEDAASAAPSVPANRLSSGTFSAPSEASPQAAEANLPFFPSPLSLPEVPIGAIIYFAKDEEPQFEARWPAPVPPLQFAVSLQGNSAVTILETVSAEEGDGPTPQGQPHGSTSSAPASDPQRPADAAPLP